MDLGPFAVAAPAARLRNAASRGAALERGFWRKADPHVRCQRPQSVLALFSRKECSYASLKACAMSAMRSDGCSMPIDSRIVESRTPIFWRMSAGTPEWVMLAGRLASDSVPPRLTASLKICSAFKNLNAADWPPAMSNENVEPAPVHCSRTGGRRSRPLRGERGNGPLLLWRGRAGNPPRAARFCQLFFHADALRGRPH